MSRMGSIETGKRSAGCGVSVAPSCARRLFDAPARRLLGVAVLVCALTWLCACVGVASAAVPSWKLDSLAVPGNLPPGGTGTLIVSATNLGAGEVNASSSKVTLRDTLPGGLTATSVHGQVGGLANLIGLRAPVTCVVVSGSLVECAFEGTLPPYEQLEAHIAVSVAAGARGSGEVNETSVEGGGAPGASLARPLTVSAEPTRFGVGAYELEGLEEEGSVDTQAGSHPFGVTATLDLNRSATAPYQPAQPKDLNFELPPGLVGNPTPLPQCSDAAFTQRIVYVNECPADTAVGVANVTIYEPEFGGLLTVMTPVFNLKPAAGEPARFGFLALIAPVILDTSVRTGGDYGITVSVNNIVQNTSFLSSQVTLWGVPGAAIHNSSRGWNCLDEGVYAYLGAEGACEAANEGAPPPFLSLPTSCTGPLRTSVLADSWLDAGSFTPSEALSEPAMDGCNRLPFEPSISVAPDESAGSTPTGLSVNVHVPQTAGLNPQGLSQANVRNTSVALPEGMQISPAAADGLQSCSQEQIAMSSPGSPSCPEQAKVATEQITSPLLSEPMEGEVYLAAQDENPFGSLIALYLYAEAPKEGIKIKLAGEVKLDERTGQIVATFPNDPQLPFENATLHFFGSDRAPLSTPALCGQYTSTASITPWSGNAPATPTSTFAITSGPNGSSCANPRPFQPSFQGGTTNLQAGGYTPLTMTMSRPDADQPLGKLSIVFPPGISAGLQGVKLCEEPQAAAGDCPAESQIGQVIASAGLGGDPFSVETGKAYITGPYGGAPFGVDVVVPAVAGPFNLGTEVVRSKIEVNPTDAHLTVVSDKFPTMLDGIPLQLQHINVTVNRPNFVFNPTSCEPTKLTGQLESSEGATADVSSPFQVSNCAALSFKPEFKVSTEAKTSRTEGATLHVRLTLPSGAQGTKANVHEVKVSLPKQLPSPLKTLQKACTEKVFAENPANCPVASRVGEAHVTTPVLEGGLKGPAYFVSHGGAKYPELIMVLVGEDGVTVQVHGETFIGKQGITTATFSTVPDVPFSTFELALPKREYPALSANGNLCQAQAAGKLLMPTEMIGQNGDKIRQSTKIAVTGCPKVKKAAKKKTHHKAAKKGKRKKK